MQKPKMMFQSTPTKDGKVKVGVPRPNGKVATIDLPPVLVPFLACKMLEDAQAADGTRVKT